MVNEISAQIISVNGEIKLPYTVLSEGKCYYSCLNYQEIPDSVNSFLIDLHHKIKYNPPFYIDGTEQLLNKIGVKQNRSDSPINREAIKHIKWDTQYYKILTKPFSFQHYFPHLDSSNIDNPFIPECAKIPTDHCFSFCVFQLPGMYSITNVLIPEKSSLPKDWQIDTKITDDEEWVIKPTFRTVNIPGLYDAMSYGSILLKSYDKKQLKSHEHYLNNYYSSWVSIDCSLNQSNLFDNFKQHLISDLKLFIYGTENLNNNKKNQQLDYLLINDLSDYLKKGKYKIKENTVDLSKLIYQIPDLYHIDDYIQDFNKNN